jgi:outer membrane cobalamin receptor
MIQLTVAASSPGAPNFFNVAEATARGLEAGVDVQEGAIDLGAEYTWLLTRVENPGFDSGPGAYFVDGEALLRRPSHSLSFRVGGALAERGRVHAQLSWVGSRADRRFDPETFETTRVTLPRYVLVGVGTSWTLTSRPRGGPSLSMSVRVENLLGEKYEEAVGFGAPGRQLYVGWTLALGGGTS